MNWVIVLILSVGPVLTLLGAGLMIWGEGRRRAGRTRTTGVVVDWVRQALGAPADRPLKRNNMPVVRFRTTDGREVQGFPVWASDTGFRRLGKRVEVWYRPEQPDNFVVRRSWLDRPFAPVVAAGLMLTFFAHGLPLLFRTFLD